jgi:hypothetical protein
VSRRREPERVGERHDAGASDKASEARAPASSVRTDFIRLGMDAVLRLADGLDEETLREAMAGETSLGALVKVLGRSEAVAATAQSAGQAQARERQALLERLRLRGVRNKERLLGRSGGTLSTAEVAARLGMTPQGVTRRRHAGKLVAVELGKHQYRYPAFQFPPDGGILPGLEEVLFLLSRWSPWAKLSFLLGENPRLDDRSPFEALTANDIEPVKKAAAAFGEQGAA